MPTYKKPRCFIAMAFAKEDTDFFYENLVLPVLRENNITPIIINRQQSNEDLNIQIIEQLKNADFCIADLSYTRPSVYFEAGFAERTIPVIYTVRKDHLDKGQPDELRVHFDLQMKPIIDWSSPEDKTFRKRLEDRVRATFLNQWKRKSNKQAQIKKSIEKFEALPLEERLILLRRKSFYALRKIGFSLSDWKSVMAEIYSREYTRSAITKGFVNYIAAMKSDKKSAQCVSIQSFESVLKKDLTQLYNLYFATGAWSLPIDHETLSKVNKFSHDAIILSLKPVPASRIENVFRHVEVVDKASLYSLNRIEDYSRPNSSGNKIKHFVNSTTRFHFLTGINSELHLKQQLDKIMKNIDTNVD
jgi:hypothetical protein